jgi:tetratricopeptide (TPR) repeat protein
MALDPYASCPCGSGKKFKWCCQPIYAGIERAFDQDANGQHEAALRTMDEVVRAHGGNPEAWGQKARLLFGHGKVEEAEEALQKAFDINPNYPYGLLLRAQFRYQEGEWGGALLLARKAVEAYDPEARDYLANAYWIIYDGEMKMNRPVAARAALRLVVRYMPADEQVRNVWDTLFGKPSTLPEVARREYTLLSPPPAEAGARRAAWDRVLQGAGDTPRLGDLARKFEELTKEDAADAAAWFNLGLARAWLGDNAAALEALDRYLDLEADETRGAVAAGLVEVLRCGQGMEDACDYHEYAFGYPLRDPQPVQAMLQEWAQSGRLVGLPAPQEGVFIALVLELTTTSLITVGSPAADAGRLAGYLLIVGNLLQVTSPLKEPFDRLREEVRQKLALGLGELRERRGPIQFQDVVAEALLFPLRKGEEEASERALAYAQRFYEETWIHRPLRSLSGNTPVDAAGFPKLRKKLRGVIQFIQDCARTGMIAKYDFDRLRRKLGLLEGAAAPAAPGAAAPQDIPAMGAAELGQLNVEGLSQEQLEQAYQAAQKLDAGDLAAHFARALVSRPPAAEHLDRFPWYSYLTQHALREGNTDAALDYLNEGEKADCEQNEGRRRNEYELRRGQVHTRRGEADAAQDVFQRLIERVPTNLKVRGSAAEAMLTLKKPDRALRFAEEGLTAARQQNDRDSEQYLMELVEAAKKQMG